MPGYVLLDLIKLDQAERLRQAEQDRLRAEARRARKRTPILKSLLLALMGS